MRIEYFGIDHPFSNHSAKPSTQIVRYALLDTYHHETEPFMIEQQIVGQGRTRGLGDRAWRWMLQLDLPAPVRTDAEVTDLAEKDYTWNFTVNLLDGVFFWFGLSFISSTTIAPLFLSKLTHSTWPIVLLAVLAQSSWYLPQLFTANWTERLARKKPAVVGLGFITERVPVLLFPAAALVATRSPMLAMFLFFWGYAWHSLGAGIIAPAWQDMVARIFPVQKRGWFFGVSSFLGTGTGALGAGLSGWILATVAFPRNFALTFAIAAGGVMISWLFIAMTREPAQRPPEILHNRQTSWKKYRRIVGEDRNFRTFLFARVLGVMGSMGVGFVTVFAIKRFGVADSTVGIYTAAMLLGQTFGNLGAGLLADRYGHKISLEVGLLLSSVGFVLAWLAPSPVWMFPIFAFLGMATGIFIVSGILIALEFSAPQDRPSYIGIANTSLGLGSIIAPLLGGWLALSGYDLVFIASACMDLLALAVMHWAVKEPRGRTRA